MKYNEGEPAEKTAVQIETQKLQMSVFSFIEQ